MASNPTAGSSPDGGAGGVLHDATFAIPLAMAGYPTAFIGKWHMGNDDPLPPLGPATGTPDADVRGRLEMLLAVDESLGRIVETLEALGKLKHTVVILTSDHG